MAILGNYISDESLSNEYKEFCIKSHLETKLNYKEIRDLCEGNVPRTFNKIIVENINTYIKTYIPRYASAFHNGRVESSVLSIGVNDHNEITGIPFNGNLELYKDFINKSIIITINQMVKVKHNGLCRCSSFKIDIDECLVNPLLLNNHVNHLLAVKDIESVKYKKDIDQYHILKKKWISKIFLYKGKLQAILDSNLSRHEFIEYLIKQNVYTQFKEVLSKNIHIPSENVKHFKHDKNSIVFWLIQFKNKIGKKLMMNKPIEPFENKNLKLEKCLVTLLSPLRSNLVNNGIRYFVLNIHFFHNPLCENQVLWKKGLKWTAQKRCDLEPQGPQCI